MSENPTGGASNERDPLEEFIKKMQEQGFDPSAGATGQGGKGTSSNAQNPFSALFGEGGQNPFGISIDPEDLKNMGMGFDPAMMQSMFAQVQAMFSGASEDVPEEISQILNSGFLNNIGSVIFGAQMAQALAQLAGEVYSSTDVGFPLAPGSSALLPNGYQQLADSIEVPPQEVLLYLAVRESALIRLHKANPWLREDLVQLVARYARGIRVDMNRMQDAASQVDMSNPDAVQEAFEGGLFSPQRTEDQELAVQRLESLLALIEGWVSVVTEDATRNLPKAPQLTEIMARRRIDGGPSEQVFENLVGLELRPRLVREAQQFWRWYENAHGIEARDGLWDTPETLPTPAELEDFTAYDARMNEISLDDVDFDSELQKLLDGGFGDAPEEK